MVTTKLDTVSNHDTLSQWEHIPLILLGAGQALNIFLWYAMGLFKTLTAQGISVAMPQQVIDWLPTVIVVVAGAAGASLDGAMVAAIMGTRDGRDGHWTWISAAMATIFSSLIAIAVYDTQLISGPWLHIAQALVLFCYMMHLRQPRKAVDATRKARTPLFAARPDARPREDSAPERPISGFRCQWCGGTHPTANAVAACKRSQTREMPLLSPDVADKRQQNGVAAHDETGH